MNNHLPKNPSKCIVMRNGIEVWIEEGEKLKKLEIVLQNLDGHTFINWEGRSFNTADMVGLFIPEDMDDMKRRKNGDWKCHGGIWHQKGERCDCLHEETKKRNEMIEKRIRDCGKCMNGWISEKGIARRCKCINDIV